MRIKFHIILSIFWFLCFIKSNAQNDSLTLVNDKYKSILFNDSDFLEVLFYKHFNNVLINNLGTFGSSYYFSTTYLNDNQSQIFAPKQINNQLLMLDGFKPFTNLTWINAGRREQVFSLHHIQKFGKQASLVFLYKRISSPGVYINQEANNSLFKGEFNYQSLNQIYHLKLSTHIDRINNQENGGLSDVQDFETDTFDRRSLYQVNLTQSYYQIKENNYAIDQKVNVINQKIDSASYHQIYIGLGNYYKTRTRNYYDYDADASLYQNTYFDSTSRFWLDSTFYKDFTHKFSLGLKHKKIDVNGFFEYHQEEYSQLTGIDTTYNNAYTGLNLEAGFSKVNIQTQFKYGLNGYNSGDIQSAFLLNYHTNDNYNINFEVRYNLIEPELYYKTYSSNHFKWDSTNFFKKQTIYLSTSVESKKYRARFFVNAKLLDKFFYYDSLVILKQHDFASHQISTGIEKDYSLWNLHFKTALIYQITSNDTILPLPAFVGRQVMYYENRLFKKALKLRTGFNVSFTTDYYGYEFMPGISQFYVQSKKKIGNYPYIDFFISLHLKRAQIFFKWEHLNAGMMNYNYFLTPTIPAHDRSFKFGVSWNMFD